MEILNNRKPEVNPFAGEQSTSNQTVIYLDKWVNEAKANKAAYEANKEPLESLYEKLNKHALKKVEWICSNFPPNLVQYTHPELVIISNQVLWNKESLLLLVKQDYEIVNRFERYLGNELMEFIGIDKNQQEVLMVSNGWIWKDVLDYALKKYNEGDY